MVKKTSLISDVARSKDVVKAKEELSSLKSMIGESKDKYTTKGISLPPELWNILYEAVDSEKRSGRRKASISQFIKEAIYKDLHNIIEKIPPEKRKQITDNLQLKIEE
jgi:hypothetical protein